MRRTATTILLAAICLAGAAARAGDVRMTGAVYRDGNSQEAMTDLLIAELSAQPQVQVLSRRELQLVLGQRAMAVAVGDSDRQGRLGRLLGVDAFAWVHLSGGAAVLEVVEAATGRGLWATQQKLDPNDPAPAIAALARQAVAAARRPPASIDPDTATLAMAEPVLAADAAAGRPAVLDALGLLAGDLEAKGVQKLHRQFLKDLVLERWMADKGLTDSQRKDLPLLGARFILACRAEGRPPQLTLALLETATGRRIGSRTVPLADAGTPQGRGGIVQWILRRIEPRRAAATEATTKPAGADLPIQPEALAPFYQGVLLHNQGAYLDAAVQFQAAIARDRRLLEPLYWMDSCFRGAGFAEVAEDFAAYVNRSRKDRWAGVSNPRALSADKGAALVGLTVGEDSSSLRLAVMMRLIDALHDATGQPAFVTGDMAQLRDEYDALVGLESVAGTTWRHAPPLLFADTLTAHLAGGASGRQLRLCAVHLLDPNQIAAATVDLEADQAAWPRQIAQACRQVLAPSPAGRPAWRRPPAILLPDAQPADLDRHFDMLAYLKQVARTPRRIEYLQFPHSNDWLTNVAMPGLHRWFIRTLGDDPAKPALEFAYDTFYLSGPERLAALERIDKQYPGSGMALAARLYLLLARSSDENLPQTQAALEELLPKLREHGAEVLSPADLSRYDDLNRLMRRALGSPDGGQGELDPAGQLWAMLMQGAAVRLRAGSGFPATLKYPGKAPDPRGRAMVDLAVLRCAWRREFDIPAKLVKDLHTRLANQPDVWAYFSVTYANKLFSNRSELTPQAIDILTDVYPAHARAVQDVLKLDPLPFDRPQVGSLVALHPSLIRAGDAKPAFRQARGEVRQAIFDLLDSSRLGKIVPMDVFALLENISGWGDPAMMPYLQKLADRSLKADPLIDGFWRIQGRWDLRLTAGRKMEMYLPFYRRVRELHPDGKVNDSTVWQYFDFGLVFFRGGRLDLAEEALAAVASYNKEVAARKEFRANTYYLLALIRQKQANIPEALRLAQQAAETADPGTGLIHVMDIGGGRGGTGSTSNLKSLANDLIAALRKDPNAPRPSPFGDGEESKRP